MSDETRRAPNRWSNIAAWLASVVVFLMMAMPGVSKVVNLDGRSLADWDSRFERWGLPGALVPVVGVAELGGGIAMLVPAAAPFGGAVVGVTMLGATATHALNDQMNRVAIPFVIAAVAFGVAWFRWRRRETKASS